MATLIDRLRDSTQNVVDKQAQKRLSAKADEVISLFEKKYLVEVTDEKGNKVKKLKDDINFMAEADALRHRVQDKHESLDKVMPEAYALVMAATYKAKCFYQRKCQVECAIALHEGNVAELATGEGKTLAATLPAFLHSLTGEAVHVVTANEYLAKRDSINMGEIYGLLIKEDACGYVLNNSIQNNDEKRKQYNCAIVYSTSSELGFDYLRDNMAKEQGDKVARGYGFAIVDEADDVLIDEATTPLIISTSLKSNAFKTDVFISDILIETLLHNPDLKSTKDVDADEDDYDIIFDEQHKTANITDSGLNYIEETLKEIITAISFDSKEEALSYIKSESKYLKFLYNYENTDQYISSGKPKKIEELISTKNIDIIFRPFIEEIKEHQKNDTDFVSYKTADLLQMLNNSIKAKFYMSDDYTIDERGKIALFSTERGRIMEGREYSEGLNQAIEAHEFGLNGITDPSISCATITLPSFFKNYTQGKCGMSGTAKSAETEFQDIYGLNVIAIQSFKPSKRIDEPASAHTFLNKSNKYEAIIEDALSAVKEGRPVLITASSLDECKVLNEKLQEAIKSRDVDAEIQLLLPIITENGKEKKINLADEAKIVSEAGKPGRITISTNMAGRGTDISLKPADVVPADIKNKINERVYKTLSIYFLTNSKNYKEDRKSFDASYQEFISGKEISDPKYKLLPKKYNEIFEREVNKQPEELRRFFYLSEDETNTLRDEIYNKVNSAGGLRVIITEYPENSRVEGQMRGRAGRQGDNGSTAVYISLQDDYLKRAYKDSYTEIVSYATKSLQKSTDAKTVNKVYSEIAELFKTTQKQMESNNSASRKLSTGFDDVLNELRNRVYEIRDEIINGSFDSAKVIPSYIKSIISDTIDNHYDGFSTDVESLNAELNERTSLLANLNLSRDDCGTFSVEDLKNKVTKQALENFNEGIKKSNMSGEELNNRIKAILLSSIDRNWALFIDEIVMIRKSAALDTFAQVDINQAYIRRFAELRNGLENTIREETILEIIKELNKDNKAEKTTSEESNK